MPHDLLFRPMLVAGFVALVLIAGYRRIQSQSTGESLDRLQEGIVILVGLRLTAVFLWLGVIAFMIDPPSMAWSSVPLPLWLRWTGVAICITTLALLAWTLRGLGRNLTDTVVTRRAATLVTHGAYRWVRHPFYGCMALVILGNALMAANWFLLAAGAVLLSFIAVRTKIEEEKLIARFGDDYRSYMRRTGRFVPRFVSR